MIGILIGTACLLALAKVIRGSRYGGRGRDGACGSRSDGWRREARWGGWDRSSFILRGLSRRLNLTPAQETEFARALSDLRDGGRTAKDALSGTRVDVAKAMRSESFDEVSLGSVIASIEDTTETLRKKGLDAFAKVHAVLDPTQREIFADIIERGPRGFGGFDAHHPYRA